MACKRQAVCGQDVRNASGHEGYQNHDGGQGTLTIDVDEGVVTLEHTDFYTESDTTAHTL